MPSNPEPELTHAERAVARELSRIYNRRADIPQESVPADHTDEAIAVVAAVRDLIAAEALRAEADTIELALPSEEAMPTMFVVPAHLQR